MSEEIIMINMIDETVNKIGDFADEFTFELEELDGKRASALVVALDPPDCTNFHCHSYGGLA